MTFFGGRDSWKGFRNGRDSQKIFMDDIDGGIGLAEGIWKQKGFMEGTCG